jgi:capsid protein
VLTQTSFSVESARAASSKALNFERFAQAIRAKENGCVTFACTDFHLQVCKLSVLLFTTCVTGSVMTRCFVQAHQSDSLFTLTSRDLSCSC